MLLAAEPSTVTFSRDIQPILAKHCVLCHGPDESEAGLRLDRASDGDGVHAIGSVITPGDAESSELLRRITTDDDAERMPPDAEPLDAAEVALLRQWIDQGAKWEQHWAFRPVVQPTVPVFDSSFEARNPVDAFVLASLQEAGLAPSPAADRYTLIKRLYYDLIGLPPTPEAVDAFVNDDSPEAYARLVDDLLASPHFGERWGRHWLDKARYADSDGYEKDRPRPNAWRYRDWVIDAVNRDLPFDQFTIEQLAGDLLPDATAMQRLATAFHRQTLTNTEGGVDQEEFRVEATFDRTETTAAVWMGLTMTCARCHNHKYDQIEQQEYYQVFAFFNDANEANMDVAESDGAMRRYHKAQQAHDEKVAALRSRYVEARAGLQPEIDAWQKEMREKLAAEAEPPVATAARIVEAKASSEAMLTASESATVSVAGPVAATDKYTLVLKAPSEPLSGIQIDLLADESLPSNGPGRMANGNFVLSHVRLYVSDDPAFEQYESVPLVAAEADFHQNNFPPANALDPDPKTGWAISPQMGKDHQIIVWSERPWNLEKDQFVQVVLDQQYGGQHTIGKFRVSTITGFDPLRSLPETVSEAIRTPLEKRTDEQREQIADQVAGMHPEVGKLAEQLAELESQTPKPPLMNVRVMVGADRQTHVLHRGDFQQPADEVDSGVLEIVRGVHPLRTRPEGDPADRLDFARWLVDSEHPLTARVAVNHVWAQLFGRGIVPTVNDFGVRGELPTHPQLLDWLAWQFPREMGWSRKELIRTIVNSATYRQASVHRPDLFAADRANEYLARQNRRRVEAEIVRDLQLHVADLLSSKIGGPSVFPPLPAGVAELSYANNFKWTTSDGADRYRRGMYTFFKRTSPHPTLISFDCPDSNTTQLQRPSSNTPLQALATLNNEVFTEAAQGLAQRVLQRSDLTNRERLDLAIRLCIVRPPDASELDAFQELLTASRHHYQIHPDDAEKLASRHRAASSDVVENAAWIATTRMIMNLDEHIVSD